MLGCILLLVTLHSKEVLYKIIKFLSATIVLLFYNIAFDFLFSGFGFVSHEMMFQWFFCNLFTNHLFDSLYLVIFIHVPYNLALSSYFPTWMVGSGTAHYPGFV